MILRSMMNKVFRTAAMKLAEGGNIDEKYIELYAIAMETALAIFINAITVMLIGGILHMFWMGIWFLVSFIPLRTYAGGYHARGYISCYVGSCVLITLLLLFLKCIVLEKNMISGIWLLFFSSLPVIFLLAPLADENKPISEKEKKVFRKRAVLLLLVELLVVIFLVYLKNMYAYAVMAAIILCALLLVMHKCKEFKMRNIIDKS